MRRTQTRERKEKSPATRRGSIALPRQKTPGARRGRLLTMLVLTGSLGAWLIARQTQKRAGAPVRRRQNWLQGPYAAITTALDRMVGWDRLPRPLGLAVLGGLRDVLRQKNLYDTTHEPSLLPPAVPPFEPRFLTERTLDGTYNDLDHPEMGMAGSRFGRNIPLEYTAPETEAELLTPNPRVVSRQLLQRTTFQPATTLNLLAACWVQFMIRDWFKHGNGSSDNLWQIELSADDPWPSRPMTIARVPQDRTQPGNGDHLPPTYLNQETHWWDASQLYGTDMRTHSLVRSGHDGKLNIGRNGLLELPKDPQLNPSLVPGWWLGLEMMQTLFTLEHNAICERLKALYPDWPDADLFARARLILSALIAKIHTVEWTPAMIAHPTTVTAMQVNWWGFQMERFQRLFGRVSQSEIVSGIPGSQTQHFGVPYALTEEFTIVYRMHPLLPDDFSFRSVYDDQLIHTYTLGELTGPAADKIARQIAMTDLFYSFGTSHPGAIVLHNYPRGLQQFKRPDGILVDLAATDILRSRELGIPRYNQFRELLHLKPARTFEELTDNPIWARELQRVYNNQIERVDLIVGMFAERRPTGFAFSDTAFRIFILMASRRLNSDRFFTQDYRPEIYTQAGLDWIRDNSMLTVLLRHYPQLSTSLYGITNAFKPWMPAVLGRQAPGAEVKKGQALATLNRS